MATRIFYRKEKLRGACWEYQVSGGWIAVPTDDGPRRLLHHRFAFYRAREVEVRTPHGTDDSLAPAPSSGSSPTAGSHCCGSPQ